MILTTSLSITYMCRFMHNGDSRSHETFHSVSLVVSDYNGQCTDHTTVNTVKWSMTGAMVVHTIVMFPIRRLGSNMEKENGHIILTCSGKWVEDSVLRISKSVQVMHSVLPTTIFTRGIRRARTNFQLDLDMSSISMTDFVKLKRCFVCR